MLKPVDPRRGNGRLFYEVGNRGGKAILATFQKAAGSLDPTTDAEFGDGALMRQGFTLLWMGWQWDVPDRPGTMRMEMPIATENGRRITGLVRGNFILNERAETALGRGPQSQGVSGPRSEQPRQRDDRARRSGREGTGHSARALAFRRRRHRRARRRLRARTHLRRRLSHRRSPRPRLRARRRARPRQLHEVRHVEREPDAGAALRDRLGRLAERPLPAALSLSGVQRGRAGAARVRRRLRSGRRRRAAGRSTTASARRRATRCSTSTSCFRSICSRSPTARPPIPRPARPTACSDAPSAPARRRRSFTC